MEKLQSFKMQTLKKQKSSPLKYRNEPSRFFGDGAVFKAKLIGILEVGEARGDKMCQEALQDLKVAIKAAGEHKQKITIHVTIEGLRLRDEKTGDSLYHHPVHKISFIAQDMTDSRAFGYIFGSPDSGHRFFGIKTDKAASQVVLAMRDLFQVVFELKKKEIELARQHIQNKITQHEHQAAIAALTNKSEPSSSSSSTLYKTSESKGVSKEKSPESVADLVDLEQELSSIQRGITQMERITPNEPTPRSIMGSVVDRDDPFGDSFISTPSTFNLLPPPPEMASKRQQKSSPIPRGDEPLAELAQVLSTKSHPHQAPLATADDDWLNSPPQSASAASTEMHESISYGEDIVNSVTNTTTTTRQESKTLRDVFTELDPLGTGKIRPYVDKKYFFQDLKNPPKKVLKELSQEMPVFDAHFGYNSKHREKSFDAFPNDEDPFAGDSFKSDPFECFPTDSPPFIPEDPKPEEKRATPSSVFNGPRLQVNLPPESGSSHWDSRLERSESISPTPQGIARSRPNSSRHNTPDVIGPKKPIFFTNSKFSKSGFSAQRLQETATAGEEAPEPPPRPDSVTYIEPPPLPPKKQLSDIIIRPSITSSSAAATTTIPTTNYSEPTRYDFLSGRKTQDDRAPPLPLPARKIPGGNQIKKIQQEDDYLTPITNDIPTLLPPPQRKDKMIRKKPDESEYLSMTDREPDLAEMSVSRLLSLGIDELAKKLNVPVSKVSQMTLIELTSYLSDYIENSRKATPPPVVFKVNFESGFGNESTFFAKFDDNFGEDNKFEADFEKFKDVKPELPVPSADRYAVLREIIEQELQTPPIVYEEKAAAAPTPPIPQPEEPPTRINLDFDKEVEAEINRLSPNLKVGNVEPINAPIKRIDTKITDVISQAKDRYAALRDIVLVEDLFDKHIVAEKEDARCNDLFEEFDSSNPKDEYPEIHILDHEVEEENISSRFSTSKDDIEIDSYLKKAMSNFSIDRDHLSPVNKTPNMSCPVQQNASTSPIRIHQSRTPPSLEPHTMNDMSTSPIPIKSATPQIQQQQQKTPALTPTSPNFGDRISPKLSTHEETLKKQSESGSLSDVVCESSPEDLNKDAVQSKDSKAEQAGSSESWAVFDQPQSPPKPDSREGSKVAKKTRGRVSPCSSDGKDGWKEENEYPRRVKPQHTSSSSRDQSPWEEENPDYRRDRRDRYAHPPMRRVQRRMDSCDEDFEYPEYDRHHRRKEHPWSPGGDYGTYDRNAYPDHRCWSPNEDGDRRPFDRYAEPKSLNSYDRRYDRNYDKRKYYNRERGRTDYPYEDAYEDVPEPAPARGKRNNYENVYEFDHYSREARRDHFYNKDTRSFESTESYDSRGRPSSFGSGEIYGSYDRDYRERYLAEKGRLLKGRNARSKPDLEVDSDNEFIGRRERFESSSLQRGRTKPSPVDEKVWAGKPWKRPASATDPGNRALDTRRVMQPPPPPPGSDGEKDRRFRRKGRPMRRDEEHVSNYATMRYPPRRRDDYYDYDPDEVNDPYYTNFYKTQPPRSMVNDKEGRYMDYPDEDDERRFKKSNSRDFQEQKERFMKFPEEKKNARMGFDYEEPSYPPPTGNGKFKFDEGSLDSAFTPTSATSAHGQPSKNFKFSHDTEMEKSPKVKQNFANFDNFPAPPPVAPPPLPTTTTTTTTAKLRFNETVQVSQFDSNTAAANMFEDNFSKTELDEADDQWNEMPAATKFRAQRSPHEHIKKSESVNIFAKKKDDPFEDDPFFGSGGNNNNNNNNVNNSKETSGDTWSKAFANFDDNM